MSEIEEFALTEPPEIITDFKVFELMTTGEDVHAYYAKGRIEFELFKEELEYNFEVECTPEMGVLKRKYMRKLPDKTGAFQYRIVDAEKGQPGAFEVTYFELYEHC